MAAKKARPVDDPFTRYLVERVMEEHDKGLTYVEIAKRMGVSTGYLSELKDGKKVASPSKKMLGGAGRLLHMTPLQFLALAKAYEEEHPAKPTAAPAEVSSGAPEGDDEVAQKNQLAACDDAVGYYAEAAIDEVKSWRVPREMPKAWWMEQICRIDEMIKKGKRS